MDRQLLERMVGATVLIIALIVIVPAVLDGPGDREPTEPARSPADESRPLRTVTITPDPGAASPPVPTPAPAGEQTGQQAVVEPPSSPADAGPRAAETDAGDSGTSESGSVEATEQPPPSATAAKTEPKPALVPDSPRGEGWVVQLGSFASRENAERLAGRVEQQGFAVYLEPLERGGRTLYRVRVGPEPSRTAAEALEKRLVAAGFKGQVTRQESSS